MDNEDELERNKIFSNDEDPMEAIAELRAQEAEETLEEEEPAEVVETLEEVPDDTETEEFNEAEDEVGKDSTDELPEEEEEEEIDTTDEVKLYKFKANGQDFEFTQEEINNQFGTVFGKAMDYTHKMQKISPYRKMISALEDEGISQDQLNVALDALKGDKGALQKLVAENAIDIYDLDNEEGEKVYRPTDYGKSETELALLEVNQQISGDVEYPQTLDVISNQWDDKSRQALADNPEWISGLHTDIKSGVFQKVSPEAMKMKMMDGGSKPDIEYYLQAGQQMFERTQQQTEDPADKLNKQFKNDSAVADKKRTASSTRSRSGTKSVVDYLADDDEKFDEWYKKLNDNN